MNEYRVWCPGEDDAYADAKIINARSPGHAAALWGERRNPREATNYEMANGGVFIVKVAMDPLTHAKTFCVGHADDGHCQARLINGDMNEPQTPQA